MNDNVWYTTNSPMVNKLIYRLREIKMRGTINHEIDPDSIIYIINALVKENCDLTYKLNNIEEKLKDDEKILDKILENSEVKKEKRGSK